MGEPVLLTPKREREEEPAVREPKHEEDEDEEHAAAPAKRPYVYTSVRLLRILYADNAVLHGTLDDYVPGDNIPGRAMALKAYADEASCGPDEAIEAGKKLDKWATAEEVNGVICATYHELTSRWMENGAWHLLDSLSLGRYTPEQRTVLIYKWRDIVNEQVQEHRYEKKIPRQFQDMLASMWRVHPGATVLVWWEAMNNLGAQQRALWIALLCPFVSEEALPKIVTKMKRKPNDAASVSLRAAETLEAVLAVFNSRS